MSVQAGIWNCDGRPVDPAFLRKLSLSVDKYGPHSDTAYVDSSLGMVYRAFNTTLESHRDCQPHVSSQGLVMTWDGRLDNREELIELFCRDLNREQTDVAIVAEVFDQCGPKC